jgi:cytochrome c oxidase assembly protein Cox11
MPSTTLTLEPGQDRRFVLVVQNTGDQPLYFFAAPHVVQPPDQALGFKFKCLCVNRAYIVGPHETWYRVVEFRLSPDFAGQQLTVMHTIIGIDKKRADAFSKDPVIPEF